MVKNVINVVSLVKIGHFWENGKNCGGCGASYIGETDRHYEVRKREHLEKDTTSSVYRHIHSNATCYHNSNSDCFSILDRADSDYAIKLKEGMHIMWEKPILNVQVKCEKIELPL